MLAEVDALASFVFHAIENDWTHPQLADRLDGGENGPVAADERDRDVTVLRTVREGPADRSYGVHVADPGGVPDPVVNRFREVLERLREEKPVESKGGRVDAGGLRPRLGGSSGMRPVRRRRIERKWSVGGRRRMFADATDQRLDQATEDALEELERVDANERHSERHTGPIHCHEVRSCSSGVMGIIA